MERVLPGSQPVQQRREAIAATLAAAIIGQASNTGAQQAVAIYAEVLEALKHPVPQK